MVSSNTPPIPAWMNKFARPGPERVLDDLSSDHRVLFDRARGLLRDVGGVRETFDWRGIPMRWSFAYEQTGMPIAYLVPEPDRPHTTLPLPMALLESLDIRKLSRPIREGILHGKQVSGTVWAEWDLASANLASDVAALLSCRRTQVASSR